LPPNTLGGISVRRKSEHEVGVACFTCLDVIVHKEVIDIDVDKVDYVENITPSTKKQKN
jgi:hypothetical protein